MQSNLPSLVAEESKQALRRRAAQKLNLECNRGKTKIDPLPIPVSSSILAKK